MRLDLTNAIADNNLILRNDINTLADAVNQIRQDIEKLKQGHQDIGKLKQAQDKTGYEYS